MATVSASGLLPPLPQLSEARTRLYETAIELFGNRGYDGVSVRDLANVLGLQPGALYAHVPSKQALLFELVQLGHDEHRERMKAALLDAGREAVDQVRALMREHVMVHLDYPALARVVSREFRCLSEEQQAAVGAVRAELEQMFIDVIARGIKHGVFREQDTFLAVKAAGAMGLRAPEWWSVETGLDREEIADAFADYVVRMLG